MIKILRALQPWSFVVGCKFLFFVPRHGSIGAKCSLRPINVSWRPSHLTQNFTAVHFHQLRNHRKTYGNVRGRSHRNVRWTIPNPAKTKCKQMVKPQLSHLEVFSCINPYDIGAALCEGIDLGNEVDPIAYTSVHHVLQAPMVGIVKITWCQVRPADQWPGSAGRRRIKIKSICYRHRSIYCTMKISQCDILIEEVAIHSSIRPSSEAFVYAKFLKFRLLM